MGWGPGALCTRTRSLSRTRAQSQGVRGSRVDSGTPLSAQWSGRKTMTLSLPSELFCVYYMCVFALFRFLFAFCSLCILCI